MSQQAAEEALAMDPARIFYVTGLGARRLGCRYGQGLIAEALIGTVTVVERHELLDDMIEMVVTEAQEGVPTFASSRSRSSFRQSVCVKREPWRSNGLNV